MNQQVENYLQEIVQDALTSASITGVQVITGTSSDIVDPGSDAIMVACDELEGVNGTLKLAKVRLMVRTSALTGARIDHSSLAGLMSDMLHSPLPAAFLMGVTGIDVNGCHVTLHTTGSGEGKTWITDIQATLGVKVAVESSSLFTYSGAVLTYG